MKLVHSVQSGNWGLLSDDGGSPGRLNGLTEEMITQLGR